MGEIEKLEIESLKDKEDDQSSPKLEEKDDDICSEVENAKEEITTKEDQMVECHKKEKEIEEAGKDIIKDKKDDQSNSKVEEKEDNICSEVENAKDEITTKDNQIAEVHKKEKEIEEVGIDIIKDKEDDQSSLKVEEKEDDICSEVENAKEEITSKEDQMAESHKKEKEIEEAGKEINKNKKDDQSSPKIEEKEDDICSENAENPENEITTEEDQIDEVHRKEKEIERVGKEIIKDKEDDQSSLKVEEKEDEEIKSAVLLKDKGEMDNEEEIAFEEKKKENLCPNIEEIQVEDRKSKEASGEKREDESQSLTRRENETTQSDEIENDKQHITKEDLEFEDEDMKIKPIEHAKSNKDIISELKERPVETERNYEIIDEEAKTKTPEIKETESELDLKDRNQSSAMVKEKEGVCKDIEVESKSAEFEDSKESVERAKA